MALVQVPPQHVNLQNGHFMISTAELDTGSGSVKCSVDETCTNKLAGFTGGVQLHYYDGNHKAIGSSAIQQYGLGQAPLIGASHRHEEFEDTAPAGAQGLLLAQFWDPKNRFGDIGNALGQAFTDVGKWVAGAAATSADFCNNNPTLCIDIALGISLAVIMVATGGSGVVFTVLIGVAS